MNDGNGPSGGIGSHGGNYGNGGGGPTPPHGDGHHTTLHRDQETATPVTATTGGNAPVDPNTKIDILHHVKICGKEHNEAVFITNDLANLHEGNSALSDRVRDNLPRLDSIQNNYSCPNCKKGGTWSAVAQDAFNGQQQASQRASMHDMFRSFRDLNNR